MEAADYVSDAYNARMASRVAVGVAACFALRYGGEVILDLIHGDEIGDDLLPLGLGTLIPGLAAPVISAIGREWERQAELQNETGGQQG